MANGNIRTSGRLEAFDTTDSDTNMSSLDHTDVVGAITNGQQERLEIALDQLDDQGFLQGRHTTTKTSANIPEMCSTNLPADHSLAHDSKIQKHLVQTLLECEGE